MEPCVRVCIVCVYARVSDSFTQDSYMYVVSRSKSWNPGCTAWVPYANGDRYRMFVLARHRHSTAVDGDAAQAYWCASGLQEQNWRVTYERENH